MIAGVEYNCAFFQVLTVPKRNCIYVVGPKKQSEYCSHMLQVYESVSVLWYVSSVSYEHCWFWELSWRRNGVFLINRPGELCPLVSRTGILGVNISKSWNSTPSVVLESIVPTLLLPHHKTHLMKSAVNEQFRTCSLFKLILSDWKPSLNLSPECLQPGFCLHWGRWCWDSCTWRHLQQVKPGSRSSTNE